VLLWAERPTWKRGVLLGVTSALAAVSRTTALGYLPAATVFALACYLVVERPGVQRVIAMAKERIATFALAVGVGCFVLWSVYLFSFGSVPGFPFRVPAPEFFLGIQESI